jgi:hypothetical protein
MKPTKHCSLLFLGALLVISFGCCRHPRSWQVVPYAPSMDPPQKDFTLAWDNDKVDANGSPLDPYWGLEKIQNEIPPREQGSHPYPCELDPYAAHCTENPTPVQDLPQFPNSLICEVGNTEAKIHGHADWIIASQQGCVNWEYQSTDSDYNFRLFPANPLRSVLTKNNDHFIGLEFDFYESIVNARLPFWQELRAEVQRENDDQRSHDPEIREILHPSDPNTDPRAVVLGLFGVDCEHGCKSEVHPVLGFAIETNPGPNDDTWVLFVRNWGNQGYCSRYRHLVDFPNNQVSILLFDDPGSDGPTVIPEKTRMFASEGSGMTFPALSYWQGRGPVLTFNFPPPEQKQVMAEVEIHYQWNKFQAPSCKRPAPVLTKRAATAQSSQTAEEYLAHLHRKLRAEKPEKMKAMLAVKEKPAFTMVEVTRPPALTVAAFIPPAKPTKKKAPKPPRLSQDLRKAHRDVSDIQSLCAANENHLPAFQGKDLSDKLCNQAKLQKELKKTQ